MKRRKFILRSILLAGASSVLYVLWWWRARLAPQDCRAVIAEVLRRRLHYLELDPASLRIFAQELQPSLDPYIRQRLAQFSLFLPVYGLFDSWAMSGSQRAGYLGLCEPIVTRYLLVTGFFPRGGSPDLGRPVTYEAGTLANPPYCGNPWANLANTA